MAAALIDEIARNGELLRESSDEGARQRLIEASDKLIQELENPIEKLARVGWGEPTRTAALRTAFELGLLTKLSDNPMSSTQLAEGTKAAPQLVARTMKYLAAFGLVKEAGPDQYLGTSFTAASAEASIDGGLIYSFEGMIPTFIGLPEYLAKNDYQLPTDPNNGPVQYGMKTELPLFEHFATNPRLASAFSNFMAGYNKMRPQWVDCYPYAERLNLSSGEGPMLVDVGGGLGQDLAAFHAKVPSGTGALILEDLPNVIEQVKAASPPLPSAIKPLAHDFFTPQPREARGANIYFIRQVMHDWLDDRCQVILGHVRDAMAKGRSKLLINEVVLPNEGASWQQTSKDLTMMSMVNGLERTEAQWRELLSEVSLKITGIWTRDVDSESVIEAVLADD